MVETATVGREGAVGLGVALGMQRARSRAVVQLPGAAAWLAASHFAQLAQSSNTLRELIACYMDLLLAQVQHAVACNALHDVEPRLCRWLLHTRDCTDSDVLPLTQEFLAQMLGVRRTTVTLIAGMLQRAGMIYYRRGVIHIRDEEALKEAACRCYRIVHDLKHGAPAVSERGGEPNVGVRSRACPPRAGRHRLASTSDQMTP